MSAQLQKPVATFRSYDEAQRVRLTCEWFGIKLPQFGYMHYSPTFTDYDGSLTQVSWIEAAADPADPEPVPGWFVDCVCEPAAGLIGPFASAEEALETSIIDERFAEWCHKDDASN